MGVGEFLATRGKEDPFPFTDEIEAVGETLRQLKTLLPALGGVLFLIGLLTASPPSGR